jgi:hypothetical protein
MYLAVYKPFGHYPWAFKYAGALIRSGTRRRWSKPSSPLSLNSLISWSTTFARKASALGPGSQSFLRLFHHASRGVSLSPSSRIGARNMASVSAHTMKTAPRVSIRSGDEGSGVMSEGPIARRFQAFEPPPSEEHSNTMARVKALDCNAVGVQYLNSWPRRKSGFSK